MQAIKASSSCKHPASSNVCRLTQEPCTNASHKGKQLLQAQSKQLTWADSHKSPAPLQATKASNSCKHRASIKHVLAHTRARHQCKNLQGQPVQQHLVPHRTDSTEVPSPEPSSQRPCRNSRCNCT